MFKPRTPTAPKVDAQQFLPWIEKYRPKSVDEIAHQEEVVATLKKSLETKNLPHLLFYGPPGTGKTSTILAIARQLYGPELMKQRVLELNASDERGINVVRTKVKNFSQVTTSLVTIGGYTPPPYKLVILDEADSMTSDAQAALRRTMETYSKNTRFCLICNYVSRIIEPLASRCAKFRFKPLSTDTLTTRIKYICQQEGVPFSTEMGDVLSDLCGGDLRRAITILQSAFALYGEETNADSLIEIAGKVPASVVTNLIKAATSNSFDQLQKAVNDAILDGYPANQIVSQVFDYIVENESMNSIQKAKIAESIAQAEKCLQDGADEFLQLMSIFSCMREVHNSNL